MGSTGKAFNGAGAVTADDNGWSRTATDLQNALGHHRLTDLDGPLLRAVFADIAATPDRTGKLQSPSALTDLRTTLRAALNVAVREELIDANPARHIEVHGYRRPHAQVCTDGRVEHWQQTGDRPAVAVWTAEQLSTFLDGVIDDPCSRSGGSPHYADYAAANSAACTGPPSTSTEGC